MFKKILNNQLSDIEKYAITIIAIISFIFLKYNLSASLVQNGNVLNLSIIMIAIGVGFFTLFSLFVFIVKEFAIKVVPVNILYYIFLIVFSIKNLIMSVISYLTFNLSYYWILNVCISLFLIVLSFLCVFFILKKYITIKKRYFNSYLIASVGYIIVVYVLWIFNI